MAQTAVVLVAIVALAAQGGSGPTPRQVLDNVDLMDVVIKPAYDDLQRALASPPADRQAWAALYQKAARLAEFENLLFIRSRAGDRRSEWTEHAGRAQQASADVAAAALLGLQSARASDFDSVRATFAPVSQGCNACHRAFSREAPTITYGKEDFKAPQR
jgi:cytochrome c556